MALLALEKDKEATTGPVNAGRLKQRLSNRNDRLMDPKWQLRESKAPNEVAITVFDTGNLNPLPIGTPLGSFIWEYHSVQQRLFA
jgi:hypothetical protein